MSPCLGGPEATPPGSRRDRASSPLLAGCDEDDGWFTRRSEHMGTRVVVVVFVIILQGRDIFFSTTTFNTVPGIITFRKEDIK